MYKALSHLKEYGISQSEEIELYDFKQFCHLIGFEDIWEFDRRWADKDWDMNKPFIKCIDLKQPKNQPKKKPIALMQ